MERILAAVDTSEISNLVLERAVELALATGAKVRLFHAFSPVPPAPVPGTLVPVEDQSVLIASAQEVLRDMLASVPENTRDGAIVEIGSAAQAVCEAARSYDADVVVIGAHKYGVIARVLGTTAAKIVNGIDRPLFVVRPLPSHDIAATKPDVANPAEGVSLLPCFRSVNAQEASGLLAEHDELRKQLEAFGVRVDLHAFTISDADELIARVRAQAAREEKLLYPWFDEEAAEELADGPSEARPTVKRESPARRRMPAAEAKM